ncbi:MAG: tlde1 domain-containing protein [Pseudomonadota bacterium]
MKIVFQISTGNLYVQTPSLAFTIPATSGRGGCMNNASVACQRTMNEGPIPVGDYYIDPAGLDDPNAIVDLARNFNPKHIADWGDFRVKITSYPSTNTFARDGFFLHGGSILGSAGCIDVGGGVVGDERTNLLKLAIRASATLIPVNVIA